MHSSKVYTKLQERLGLSDHLALLNLMLAKIATNLRVYGKAEELVHATLNLFQVHCCSPCSARASGAAPPCGPSPQLPASLPNLLPAHLAFPSPLGPLLQDLASGYMSGKLLLKLDAIAFILANHTSAHFAFLDHPTNSRNRTLFYSTLARLLFMEDTPARFKAFISPLQTVRAAAASGCKRLQAAAALQLRRGHCPGTGPA
jgi:exportin-7